MMFQRVASLAELEATDFLPVVVDGREILLYRLDGEVYACQRLCPHQGQDLSEGLLSRGSIICSGHAWRFDARTGAHVDNPRVCLDTYRVQIEGGQILLDPAPRHLIKGADSQ